MKQLTPEEAEQERKIHRAWTARWKRECEEGEDIQTFTSRINHLDKMTLMYNAALMYENNTQAQDLYQQSITRYNYYKDLYDKQQYE